MFLTLCFQFVGTQYHARTSDKVQEWPPTPLRAFAALVAAAGPVIHPEAAAALRWLETRGAPTLCTPKALPSKGLINHVVDNYEEGDYRGRKPLTRSEKVVHPTIMVGDPIVRFIWKVDAWDQNHVGVLSDIALKIPYLGQACNVGHGWMTFEENGQHTGVVWVPGGGAGVPVPCAGTFDALCRRHAEKLANAGFKGIVRLGDVCQKDVVQYSRLADLRSSSALVFDLLDPTGSGFVIRDAPTEGFKVAGMLRHVLKTAAEASGWGQDKINSVILGHGNPGTGRFILCPLPSRQQGEGYDRVTEIRRVLITATPGADREMAWSERALSGAFLVDEGTHEDIAMLSPTKADSGVLRAYLRPSMVHTSVTPVCIPRVKTAQIEGLLRYALHYAGMPDELALGSGIEWSTGHGFLPGTCPPGDYTVRDSLKKCLRVHVRITWRDRTGCPVRVPGPICIGDGRYHGTGMLVGD
jgi:CRISPR-associated protein Csb2